MLPEDTRKTLIVRARIRGAGIAEISVVPAWIDDTAVPHVLRSDDPRFGEVIEYLAQASRQAGFCLRYDLQSDGAVLSAG